VSFTRANKDILIAERLFSISASGDAVLSVISDFNLVDNTDSYNPKILQDPLKADKSDFDNLAGRVTTAEEAIGESQNNISTLQSDMTTAKSSIETLQDDVTAVQNDIDTLQENDAEQDGRLDTLEQEFDGLVIPVIPIALRNEYWAWDSSLSYDTDTVLPLNQIFYLDTDNTVKSPTDASIIDFVIGVKRSYSDYSDTPSRYFIISEGYAVSRDIANGTVTIRANNIDNIGEWNAFTPFRKDTIIRFRDSLHRHIDECNDRFKRFV
jgi:hypothetical protein